jgi:AcrR family transcriptional regulator
MNASLKAKTNGRRGGARERLIEAAARHFAEYGFEGANQRAIQRDADVNSAAVHYYFGSKEALYRKVIETHLAGIQIERLRLIEAIPKGTLGSDRLKALVSAYIGPHMELAFSEAGQPYCRILARTLIELQKPINDVFEEIVSPVRQIFVDELRGIYPAASLRTISKILTMTIILMADAPYNANWLVLPGEHPSKDGPKEWIETVQTFICAGIEAHCRSSEIVSSNEATDRG